MRAHALPIRGKWLLLLGAIALIAAHGVLLRYAVARPVLSTTAVAAIVLMVAVKVLAFAWSRRRRGTESPGDPR